MLTRRRFFKSIGSAILGTTIVLQLGDSLVPKILISEPEAITYLPTYKQLCELYSRCSYGKEEPTNIYVSYIVYEAILDGMVLDRQQVFYSKNNGGGIKFRNAVIRPDILRDNTNAIHCYGSKYRNCGRLNLVTGKFI